MEEKKQKLIECIESIQNPKLVSFLLDLLNSLIKKWGS